MTLFKIYTGILHCSNCMSNWDEAIKYGEDSTKGWVLEIDIK